MKLNKLLKDFYDQELSEYLRWVTYREKLEQFLNKNDINPKYDLSISRWIMVVGNENIFNEQAKNNCMVRFDNGFECRYNSKHPMAVLSHFKIE